MKFAVVLLLGAALLAHVKSETDTDAVDVPEAPAGGIDIQGFLDAHNDARDSETEADPPLEHVTWDAALAANCEVNVAQCKMEHDSSTFRKSGTSYSWVGQNLYARFCNMEYTDREYAYRSLDKWMGEKQYWDTTTKKCNKDWWYCAHYTQVIWRTSTKVGCAIKKCQGTDRKETYVCCNYGPGGNWSGQTPY